jgi:hypothetical protein
MKIVSDLYKKLKEVDFFRTQFEEEDGKKNILFIDPVMTNFDFYSMIVPYLSLEETGKYKTAMTGMYRYSEIDAKPPTKLTSVEILWADVIVFPMSLEPYGEEGDLFDQIREINPEIKIIQTVEFDFYEIALDHFMFDDEKIKKLIQLTKNKVSKKMVSDSKKEMRKKTVEILESNSRSADRLMVLNYNLKSKLESKGFKSVEYVPILVEEGSFKENIDFMDTLGVKGTSGMCYLSCELNDQTKVAFGDFIPYFEQLKEQHKDNFKLIVIGDHPIKYFPNFEVEFHHLSKGSIIHQFKSVVKSSADIHLILNKKNEYSSNSETLFSFVDRGLFGIPIASLSVSPMKEVITNGQNGFLMNNRKDLVEIIDGIIKDKSTLRDMSKTLKDTVRQTSQINEDNLEWLGSIFCDGYKTDPDEE